MSESESARIENILTEQSPDRLSLTCPNGQGDITFEIHAEREGDNYKLKSYSYLIIPMTGYVSDDLGSYDCDGKLVIRRSLPDDDTKQESRLYFVRNYDGVIEKEEARNKSIFHRRFNLAVGELNSAFKEYFYGQERRAFAFLHANSYKEAKKILDPNDMTFDEMVKETQSKEMGSRILKMQIMLHKGQSGWHNGWWIG